MKSKLSKEQKETYQAMLSLAVGGAKISDYDWLNGLLAVVIRYRHGPKALKEVFENKRSYEIRSDIQVAEVFPQETIGACGKIIRNWDNIGFFITEDFLFITKDKFPDLPKDFKESEEFGSLLTDEEIAKLNEGLDKILHTKEVNKHD